MGPQTVCVVSYHHFRFSRMQCQLIEFVPGTDSFKDTVQLNYYIIWIVANNILAAVVLSAFKWSLPSFMLIIYINWVQPGA